MWVTRSASDQPGQVGIGVAGSASRGDGHPGIEVLGVQIEQVDPVAVRGEHAGDQPGDMGGERVAARVGDDDQRGPGCRGVLDLVVLHGSPPCGPASRTIGYASQLLRAVPPVLVVSDDVEVYSCMEFVATDAAARPAGAQARMDRLLDWALVCTLRAWFEGQDTEAPGWYRGPADPVVGPALDAMHGQLGAGWTVATLAARAGVSRALFARRFTEVMGQPPLAYLTECRMDEAEGLLADRSLTVAQIAKAVGYADSFGFSAAFKRHRGVRPSDFRAAGAVGG